MSEAHRLTIETAQRNGTYAVAVAGELDLAVTPALEQALAEAERSEAKRILLDIDGLEFIDSTGMQAIVHAARRSLNGADRLRLTRGRGHVAAMFQLTALDQTLPFVDGPVDTPIVASGR
jgi:anti-anti-sigma factor